MSFTIDTVTYDKAARYPIGHGYGARTASPTAIVVHSTSNSKANTPFSSEADYLYSRPDVSADYLVGKDGRIVRFLDSRKYYAWHAGGKQPDGTWTAQPAFANPKSIGIELHHSTPDPPYPAAQLDALGWLLKQLVPQFHIVVTMIDTHGQIALPGPYDRKVDPDDWPRSQFIAWRDALFGSGTYYVRGAAIHEGPALTYPIALGGTAFLPSGSTVEIDEIKPGGWGHLKDGRGFVLLEQVSRS